ncbi:MAG TPA: hypothetical protein VF146_15745 [Bryobacteraceae bacterium]
MTLNGDKGTPIAAYVARPFGAGTFPGGCPPSPGLERVYIETSLRASLLALDGSITSYKVGVETLELGPTARGSFFTALQAAGMPDVPGAFSVVSQHQVIPSATLVEIAKFISTFDQVTTRERWQAAAQRDAPAIAQSKRPEVCFFSAWDFHLTPEHGCQLIEFNDNGSGFLFAAIINDLYHSALALGQDKSIAPPVEFAAFNQHIADLVEQEARSFFGKAPDGLFLVLDDIESLQRGKFRAELTLLCNLFRGKGWQAEVGSPPETRWNGRQLLFRERPVSFVVNRSTDFYWRSEDFLALRRAYEVFTSLPTPSPIPRAVTNGYWNGYRCRNGTTS